MANEQPEDQSDKDAAGTPAIPTPKDIAEHAAKAGGEPEYTTGDYPKDTPLSAMSAEQQVAYWKEKARKHEDREKQLKHRIETMQPDPDPADKPADGKASTGGDDGSHDDSDLRSTVEDLKKRLAERDVADARKDVLIAHPNISEKMLELCGEKNPESIRAWGDRLAEMLTEDTDDTPAKPDGRRPNRSTILARRGAYSNLSPTTPAKGDRNAAYTKAMAKYGHGRK